jgi:hypothetical protein
MYGEDDGGLPPGGTWPERGPCEVGPCPTCWYDQSMSSPCWQQAWHHGDHQCSYGHWWGAEGQASCSSTCPYCDSRSCELERMHVDANIAHEHGPGNGGEAHKWQ